MELYNLCSGRADDLKIPVQLHLADNGEFLSQTLGSSQPTAGKHVLIQNSNNESIPLKIFQSKLCGCSATRLRLPIKGF